jgi:hypothetical protein
MKTIVTGVAALLVLGGLWLAGIIAGLLAAAIAIDALDHLGRALLGW